MWYFAIGAMMHPYCLETRNMSPQESHPAILLDYKLIWITHMGWACAVPAKGESFHGVLHKVTQKEMDHLDVLEKANTRRTATVRLYDGTEMLCTDYSQTDEFINRPDRQKDKDPRERYIDVLCEGAKIHGVSQGYIDLLKSLPNQPRKTPD